MVIFTNQEAAVGAGFDYDNAIGSPPPSGGGYTYSGEVGGLKHYPRDGEYVIEISAAGQYTTRDFPLDGPPRIVVDFMGVDLNLSSKQYQINAGNIQKVRVGHHKAEGYTRIVIDLSRSTTYRIEPDYNLVRIVMPAQ
jgi:hypothetical protein